MDRSVPVDFNDALSRYLSPAQLVRIRAVSVGIAGAGGIGSNCAACLVRCGFDKLTIAEFDAVEPSNLNRQFYFADQIGRPKADCLAENLRRINPGVCAGIARGRLDARSIPAAFAGCDAVVEAFDGASDKALLVSLLASSGKLIVSASGIAGYGRTGRIAVRRVHDLLYVVGDGVSEVCKEMPPLAPRVLLAAAAMADLVLEWALTGEVKL